MGRRRMMATVLAGGESYSQRIKNIFGTSLIAYWPLNEASGTVAYDRSGNGRNGTYANVTLGQTGIGDGGKCPAFNGTSSRLHIYSTSLRDAFNGAEGTMGIWVRSPNASAWNNAFGRIFQLYTTANDYCALDSTANTIVFNYTSGSGTVVKSISYKLPATATRWFNLILRWSKTEDKFNAYVNGIDIFGDVTGLGVFGGTLNTIYTYIGALSAGANFWEGNIAHAWIINQPITAAQQAVASKAFGAYKRFTMIGDSITGSFTYSFSRKVPAGYTQPSYVTIRSTGGGGIIDGTLATHVAAAANDSADVIIIEIGTNDNNAGNMTTLQATAEAQISALKASNPNATIYWMNVLPRWTNVGGGTVVDKSNIRTAIAAACTAQDITCWDTFSTPWITAAQTLDGLHPNAAGHTVIELEVLARL